MVYSISKSFLATAYGFALSEGKITRETKLVDVFPELMKKKDNDLNEFDKMQEFIKEHIADITGLQDYFDFIIYGFS